MLNNIYAIRYVAGQPAEIIFPNRLLATREKILQTCSALSNKDTFRIFVWNIFKQQRAKWLSVLNNFGKNAHLVLLQEAQTTPELVKFATTNYITADQVPAIVLLQHFSGVMTISAVQPVYSCPLLEREPILGLAKSTLVTIYILSSYTDLLMVINIHAVNFCLGIEVYNKQLINIGNYINNHNGPVIMAGDFNAWSKQRINALHSFACDMSLIEVPFINDQRSRAFGKPLDFVFYRGLNLQESSVIVTKASDHNPLIVEFSKI